MPDEAAPPRHRREPFDRTSETARAGDRSWDEGTYRRRILVRTDDTTTVGELEDDFHHFAIELEHPDGVITDVRALAVRHPWDVCASADDPIRAVIGTAVTDDPSVLGHLEARHNCTHVFDLAGLAVAHAGRPDVTRCFDAAVTDPDDTGGRTATLWVDGGLALHWELDQRAVVGPDRWAGIPLWKGFMRWATTQLDGPTAEAALVLRRAIDISRGRMDDLDLYRSNTELNHILDGICHAYTPENRDIGVRITGSARDFSERPELLLADFESRNPTNA